MTIFDSNGNIEFQKLPSEIVKEMRFKKLKKHAKKYFDIEKGLFESKKDFRKRVVERAKHG
jgi:hypothetical protein